MKASEKVQRAKVQVTIFQPFWASLLLRMDIEPRDDAWFAAKGLQPDIATDGKAIYYSEAFIDTLTLRQTESILCHEIGHGMLHHATRRDWRDREMWNVAADHAVNLILKDSQIDLPDGALCDPQYADKSVEQTYAILEKQAQKQPKGSGGNGKGGGKGSPCQQPGSVFDSSDSAAERSHQEQEWQVAVQQAAQSAKQAGNLPASLERFIEKMKEPVIDWVTQLRQYFEKLTPHDLTWFPVNRRYVAQGDFLPSVEKEGFGDIVIFTDTSGSIDLDMLAQFVSEINCIISEIKPTRVYCGYCDTQISHVDEFGEGEELVVKATGGGGTDFAPPFRWIAKQGLNPKVMIYLTDLQGPCEGVAEPDFPVLWVTQDKQLEGKFGTTLRMPISGE